MTDNTLDPQEVEAQEPELLPKREAMTIIPTTGDWAGMEGISGAGAPAPAADSTVPPGGSDAASGAAGTANDSAGLAQTNADASGSGDETVTSEDQHQTVTQSDSASADS